MTQVASADVPIRHSANATYDGTMSTLNTAARPTGLSVIQAVSSIQNRTTGSTARPHTIASTTTIETTVNASRHSLITPFL